MAAQLVENNILLKLIWKVIYLISYLENWRPKWEVNGTEESSFTFMETDIDAIMNEPGILELEDPLKQNDDGN